METRPLEITLISAKDLKDVSHFFKMDVYVVVTISGDPRTQQNSPVDRDGGTSPKWNHSMNFTVNESAAKTNLLNLIFQLRSDRVLRGDKQIGEVHVPIKELLDHTGDGRSAITVTYPVRKSSGKAKGKLKFSYKFGAVHATPLAAHAHTGNYPTYPPPVAAAGPHPPAFSPPKDAFFAYPPPAAYPPPDPHGSTGSTYPPPPVAGVPYPPVHNGVYPPQVWDPKIGPNSTYPPPVMAEPYPPAAAGSYSQPPPAGYPPTASYVEDQGYRNHEYGGYPPPGQLPPPPAGYPPIGQGYGYPSTSATAT